VPEADNVEIGRLRWPVKIITREQQAQVGGVGIDELVRDLQIIHADIQPVGALTFWGTAGEQIEAPITHRIFVRWLDYLNQSQAVVRETIRPDNTTRTEMFRVRRVREVAGRKRFMILECQLEDAA
jgi:hypothetical protein